MNREKRFRKRTYRNIGEILRDTIYILSRRQKIRPLMRGGALDDKFRERLMLTVTEVNGCRYCQYAHARMALASGLSQSEIDALSSGALEDCPPEQLKALLYAQHWAETNASPDPEIRQGILEQYGDETMQAIELSLRMIRMGNLMGNTWDYLLYKTSFGRLGGA
jgi:AhpD family alkylhydroperoxidase